MMHKVETGTPSQLLLNARQAAAMLNISTRMLYTLLRQGLPSVKLGGRRLFRPESLAAWVAQREQASTEAKPKAK